MFLLFSFAGVGLERLISTIHPNPPLSALRFFSLLRFGKTKLLFCSHLNRNADKEGLWQGSALHCFAIVIVASSACNNRLEISIWSPTTTGETAMFLLFSLRGRTDVLSHIYNPPKPSFKCTSFLFVATVRQNKRVCSALALIATLIRRACGKALPCIASQNMWLLQSR